MSTQITDFGIEVKKKLLDNRMSTTALAEMVAEKTGLFCDSKYLSAIFNGKRNAPKIKAAIREILNIEEVQ